MYMLYSNCLNIVQSFIAQGKLGFWAGLALPHTIALAVILLLFAQRLALFSRFRRPLRNGAAA
jgi:lipopolysaccharide export system permease protein